jgi:hypothetical protein
MQDLLQGIPARRIKPFDGLAVTSDIWEEAHETHRQGLRYHNLLAHGRGILAGLEIVASDPPDGSVYIRAGAALDPDGRLIVVREPFSYDLGQADGLVHLVLSYEEGAPRTGECGQVKDVLFVDEQFGLEVRSGRPPAPCVELARLRRKGKGAAIRNAADPAQPCDNELDLRFRRQQEPALPEAISLAVCYAGSPPERRHGVGAMRLAESLRQASRLRVAVDDDVALSSDSALADYALILLVGSKGHQLKRDEMTALYAYLQAGGAVLVESCRQNAAQAAAADAAFDDLFTSLGLQPTPVPAGHPLLTRPYLFAAPPDGFETEGAPALKAANALILSTFDYGCLWQGERRGMPATRDEIRAALEWGANVVDFAARRQATRRRAAVP